MAAKNPDITDQEDMVVMSGGKTQPMEARNGSMDVAEVSKPSSVIYGVDDVPPWYLSILLGFQHYLTMFGSTVSIPFILTPALCIADDDPARGYIISTILFVSGLVTLLQTTIGVRLPIVQGGTFSFLVPTFAILALPRWQCPTSEIMANMTAEGRTELWQVRMREIQGAIIVASTFQVAIGFFGVIGIILRFITPLAITPTIALVGLSLFETASGLASKNWAISMLTIIMITIFSQYLRDVGVTFFTYSRSRGCGITKVQIFKLFPVLLAIVLAWLFCAILTVAGAFDAKNAARTDINIRALQEAPWFYFPYPVQWGLPTVSTAAVFGMLAGVLASMVESVGDYYACARLAGAPPPPVHAVNRGIGMEGIGCIIAGLWGSGNGTTSYSENIGAIGVTKVGSRRVVQYGALMMLLFGMIGKFGALFITIPSPIVGAIFIVMFGMITAVGLSNLQFVDLNSSRNLFILGFSLFFGLTLPHWMKSNPDTIATGSAIFDQIVTVLLSTSMFIGGFLGFFLDNTIPGTDEERGIVSWNRQKERLDGTTDAEIDTYQMPVGMSVIRRYKWLTYLPFSPTYKDWTITPINCCKRKSGSLRVTRKDTE